MKGSGSGIEAARVEIDGPISWFASVLPKSEAVSSGMDSIIISAGLVTGAGSDPPSNSCAASAVPSATVVLPLVSPGNNPSTKVQKKECKY